MNTIIHDFLAETDDDVLSTFVTGDKEKLKNVSQIKVLIKTGKLVGEPFTIHDLMAAIEKELVSRGATEAQPTVKAMLKPIQHDPKAELVVKAPELPLPQKIAPQPKETKKQAKKAAAPILHLDIIAKLAIMDDDTLLAAIRVFQVFPATSGDMHAPGIKMQDWEEACWDEALARELDFELEVVSTAAECDKARLGPKDDQFQFEEEVA